MPDARGITHLLCGQPHERSRGSDDEEVARLATRQRGIVARRQLLALGLGRRAIDHRLQAGRLRPLFAGVYAVGHEAIDFPGRATAALLALAPGVVISHGSALALRDLMAPPYLVHVTGCQPRSAKAGVAYHRSVFRKEDIEVVAGIPATTVPRALLDTSPSLPPTRLHRLIKDAEFRKLIQLSDLLEILERYPRRQGRRNLAALVATLDGRRTRSPLEDRFLALCRRHRLPLPETNVRMFVAGRWLELDCVWRQARLVVELDGRDAHAREIAFEADRARDRALAACGWTALRMTSPQVTHEHALIARELRAILDPRGIGPPGGD